MVGIDIGDHGQHRLQVQKRCVGFVGFDNDELATAQTRVGACRLQAPADHERRIHLRFREDARDQARGGGFSVGAGDGNALL